MSRERTKKIKVYNKDNLKNPIAVFTGNRPDSKEAMRNIMKDPKIFIEQNGSSTLDFSMLVDSQKWKDIKDIENIYEVDGRRYTALDENSYTYQGNTVTVNLVETWYLLSKQFIQAYNTPKEREGIDEHTVVLLPKSTEPLVINGVKYSDSEVPYPRGSAGYNLWALLKPTKWSLGICDVMVDGFSPADDFGVFNVETDMKSILDNIKLVQSLYGGILVFDSVNNIVHLRDENKWDTDTGFTIREGKNLKTPVEIRQNNDIRTIVYPLGDGKLNIKAVNNGKNYLENYSYTKEKFVEIIENPDIYDQKQLKFWGERQLQKICKPRREFLASVLDVSTTKEYSFEAFDLNDIGTVYYADPDTEITKSEKQRIISLSYLVFTPYNCDISLGDKAKNVREIIKQAFDKSEVVDDTINGNGTISGNKVIVDSYDKNGVISKATITKIANEQHAMIELNTQYITKTSEALANFKVEVTKTYATIESLTQFKTETTQALTSIKQYADKTFATIQSFTEFKTATSQSLTNITQRVNQNSSNISLNARHISDNEEHIAQVEILADDNRSEIRLVADEVKVQGRLIADKASISQLNSVSAKINNLAVNDLKIGGRRVSTSYKTWIQSVNVSGTFVRSVDFERKKVTFGDVSFRSTGLSGYVLTT